VSAVVLIVVAISAAPLVTPAGRPVWQAKSGVVDVLGVNNVLESQILRPVPGAGTVTVAVLVIPMQMSETACPQTTEIEPDHSFGPPSALPPTAPSELLTLVQLLQSLLMFAVPSGLVPVANEVKPAGLPSSRNWKG